MIIVIFQLTQQFIVDAWTKIESCRLYYIRKEQGSFRTEMYNGLMDYVYNKAANSSSVIGKMVILPSSYTGSPRVIQQNFLDSMTTCQNSGKPDLFLIMTCNTHWKEITENLNENENAIDRPDIVTRVFHEIINILKDELLEKNIFGKVIAFIYVIEFQKRRLPHIHMLLYLQDSDKLFNTELIDSVVTTEIPDENLYPELNKLFKQHIIMVLVAIKMYIRPV